MFPFQMRSDVLRKPAGDRFHLQAVRLQRCALRQPHGPMRQLSREHDRVELQGMQTGPFRKSHRFRLQT